MQYHAPFDQLPGNPNAGYADANASTGNPGSIPSAGALEYPQREIINVETAAGLTPSDADQAQLLRAIRGGKLTTFADQSTAANTIVLTPGTAHNDLHQGLPFRIFPAFTNTNATVLVRVNTLQGNLLRRDGTALAPGDSQAGVPLDIVSDGTNFRIMGFAPSDIANLVAAAATAAGYVQIGDQSYGASASDRVIATNAAFTVPRSITLPSAGARLAGDTLVFMDRAGAVSAFNPLTFAGTGTDTLDGAPSFAIGAPYQVVTFRSDGSGKWTYDRKASTAFRASGDADVTVLPTDGTVSTNVPLTASRTWTLPAANAVKAGTPIVLTDIFGACGAGTTVTLAAKGSDTLNGQASILLSTAFFQAMAISDGVSRWAIQVVDAKQFQTVTASLADGGVYVSVKDASHLQILPKNGGTIYVGGVLQQIPSAGLALPNVYNGVAASALTQFFLYLGVVAGVLTFELSTTGHVTDSAGREVKIGDASRRLVGWCYTNASGQFQNDTTFRGLSNFFNRQPLLIDGGVVSGTTVPGGATTTIDTIPFFAWANETVELTLYTETASQSSTGTLLLDNNAVGHGFSYPINNSNYGSVIWYKEPSQEGLHVTKANISVGGSSPVTLSYVRHFGYTRG